MLPTPLSSVKMVVVGASSGVGRAVAQQALEAGAEVLVAARRRDRLDELVEAHPDRGHAMELDVTDAPACGEFGRAVADRLGSVDLAVVATGRTLLRTIADTSMEDWSSVLSTNVSGVNQVVQAVVPSMADDGIVAAVSSDSVDRPRAGLGAYTASKAALEVSFEVWRHERAPLRFSIVTIGGTTPTEASDEFDPDLFGSVMGDWVASGMMQSAYMETTELASAMLGILGVAHAAPGVNIDTVVLRSPAPIPGTMADARRSSA